jgi:citrate lyase subunit beta / citryl-CoA lyase
MLAKAAGLPADQVFLDLEDSVAPDLKTDETRESVVRALLDNDWAASTLVVRVNGVDTPWCARDLQQVVGSAGARLHCVMVPKVEDHDHLHFVHHLLTQIEGAAGLTRRIGIEAQIESARGLINIERIAQATDRLETLIFGPGDYAASVGIPQLSVGAIDPDYPGDRWHYPLSRIVTTARAFGLQAIDGPYAAIRDGDGFRESARRAQLLGLDGKWVLHPDQIAIANDVFTPPQDQYEQAERILDSYRTFTEVEGVGAAMFEGEMIDEASRKMAEGIAQRGRAAGMTAGETQAQS